MKEQSLIDGPGGRSRSPRISPQELARLSSVLRSRSIAALALSLVAIGWLVAAFFTRTILPPLAIGLFTSVSLGFVMASITVFNTSKRFGTEMAKEKLALKSLKTVTLVELAVAAVSVGASLALHRPSFIAGCIALVLGAHCLAMTRVFHVRIGAITSVLLVVIGLIGISAATLNVDVSVVAPDVAVAAASVLWLTAAAMLAMGVHALMLMTVSRREKGK
jgi:hypothetical protein